jgi:DNA (cytosine-5)-methyltransferase 1
MTIGSLFSGIGGLELGLELAGFGPVVWQVEQDAFCRQVLEAHWPHVDRSITDVREATSLQKVDLLCGGFPCQDVSGAGRGAGLAGARSGLWYEFYRIVHQLQPAYLVVENVASGKRRWLPTVRRMLESIDYRTRAVQISAADVGAPHLRERVFVLAVADPYGANIRKQSGGSRGKSGSEEAIAQWLGASVDYAHSVRQPQCSRDEPKRRGRIVDTSQTLGDPQSPGCAQLWGAAEPNRAGPARESECQLGRVPDGIPHRLDLPAWWPFGQGDMQDPREPSRTIGKGVDRFRNRRLKALGNAVVPHCAYVAGLVLQEWIRELEVSTHG